MTEIRFYDIGILIVHQSDAVLAVWGGAWITPTTSRPYYPFIIKGLLAETIYSILERPRLGCVNTGDYEEVYKWMKDNMKPGTYE